MSRPNLDPDFDELQPIERRTGFLGVTRPSVGRDTVNEVADSLRSGWLVTGPKVRKLERRHPVDPGECQERRT